MGMSELCTAIVSSSTGDSAKLRTIHLLNLCFELCAKASHTQTLDRNNPRNFLLGLGCVKLRISDLIMPGLSVFITFLTSKLPPLRSTLRETLHEASVITKKIKIKGLINRCIYRKSHANLIKKTTKEGKCYYESMKSILLIRCKRAIGKECISAHAKLL
jgi:hypothetical protein